MGLRFRKSVKILPGVKLNFSKSGTSVTVGKRGMSANFSSRGTRTTVGIPGTGLSYTTYSRKSEQTKTLENNKSQSQEFGWELLIPMLGAALTFILFADGQLGWGILGLVITFIILIPLAIIIRHSHRQNNKTEKKVANDTQNEPINHHANVYNESNTPSKVDIFYQELKIRQLKFAACNKIVDSINDFDVFNNRMADLLDHIEWSYRMQREGMPSKVNMTYEQAIADWGVCYNDNAVRIAKHISASADTAQKAKNRIPKIEQIRSSLKDAPNKRGSGFAINNLLSKLKSK